MKELWLARDFSGIQIFREEPCKPGDGKAERDFWIPRDNDNWILEHLHPHQIKALGFPRIRKDTKCKIRLTVEKI